MKIIPLRPQPSRVWPEPPPSPNARAAKEVVLAMAHQQLRATQQLIDRLTAELAADPHA